MEETLKLNNPHIQYLNFDDHGYSVLDVTPARTQMDWYAIGDRANRRAGSRWLTSWATTAGSQQVRRVERPVA